MLKELLNMEKQDTETLNVLTSNDLQKQVTMVGQITDRIFDKDGNFVEERVGENLVVNTFLNLVMALLKNHANMKGIQYWAVGSGHSNWDSSLPNPSATDTRLTSEIGRVAISPSEIKFLTPSSFTESSTPTNVIQITHTFGTGDCNGAWREFGLFGGNATISANSGIMLNKRHHAVLTKTNEMSVERVMRFTLTLN